MVVVAAEEATAETEVYRINIAVAAVVAMAETVELVAVVME